jgi:hypothetical protein
MKGVVRPHAIPTRRKEMSQRRAEGWSAVGGGLRGLGSSEPIVKFRWWLERVQGVAVSEVIRGKKCGRCTLVESWNRYSLDK